MNEEILQYLWNFKKFQHFDFVSVDGKNIEILDFGEWNKNSGPDFLFAKIKIDNIIFAGNIEIHTKASDWFFHNHSGNPEFGNLILHAVYITTATFRNWKVNRFRLWNSEIISMKL